MKTIAICGISKSGRTQVSSEFIKNGFMDMDIGLYRTEGQDPISALLVDWRKISNKILLHNSTIPGIVIDGVNTEDEIAALTSAGIICVYVSNPVVEIIPTNSPGIYDIHHDSKMRAKCQYMIHINKVTVGVQRIIQLLFQQE